MDTPTPTGQCGIRSYAYGPHSSVGNREHTHHQMKASMQASKHAASAVASTYAHACGAFVRLLKQWTMDDAHADAYVRVLP